MKKIHSWHHETATGLVSFLVIQAVLVYVFGSLSIARGNLWYYLLALLFLIAGLQNLARLIRKAVRIHA